MKVCHAAELIVAVAGIGAVRVTTTVAALHHDPDRVAVALRRVSTFTLPPTPDIVDRAVTCDAEVIEVIPGDITAKTRRAVAGVL